MTGLVIIFNGRVLAAACFLPLTENPYLSKELGTRHRSAIGITRTQRCDLPGGFRGDRDDLPGRGRQDYQGPSGLDLEKRLEEVLPAG